MYRVKTKRYQWALDLLFGVILVGPLFLFTAGILGPEAVYITIGSGLGYVIHVTQKMMIFDDMLKESIQDEAKETVEKEAEEKVEEKVGEINGE